MINELVTTLYSSLLKIVVNREFPTRQAAVRTRMAAYHPEAVFQGPLIDPPEQRCRGHAAHHCACTLERDQDARTVLRADES